MKKINKILVLFALLTFAIGSQSYMPPLPTTTQVKVWNIPDCYAVRIYTTGPLFSAPWTVQADMQEVSDPNDPENVSMDLAYYDTSSPPTYVQIYTKATSSSTWVYRGDISSNDSDATIYSNNNLLYWFEFDFEDLEAPPPCP